MRDGRSLRSLLTSSHRAGPKTSDNGLSSRDRNCQRRDGAVTPSPGRRRLRFSFQINDVKDLTGSIPAPPITPGGARSGVSSRARIRCQSTLRLLGELPIRAHKPLWGPQGRTPISPCESIEEAETTADITKKQGLKPAFRWSAARLGPCNEGGDIGGAADRRNRPAVRRRGAHPTLQGPRRPA